MKKLDRLEEVEKKRKRHNEELLKRMAAGDSLKSHDSEASWFPPRPIIEKDEVALKRLYSPKNEDENQK